MEDNPYKSPADCDIEPRPTPVLVKVVNGLILGFVLDALLLLFIHLRDGWPTGYF